MAKVSNPYLSQIERGMYRPSADVLKSLASALQISAETLFARAGLLDDTAEESCTVEEAIRLDRGLAPKEKEALIGVYRSFLRR
jgi:transcriptional regulator with XRE-family HTH domain